MAEKVPTIPGKKAYLVCVLMTTVLVTVGAIVAALASRPPKAVYESLEYGLHQHGQQQEPLEIARDVIAAEEEAFALALLDDTDRVDEEAADEEELPFKEDEYRNRLLVSHNAGMYHALLSCNPEDFAEVSCQSLDYSTISSAETFVVPCGACLEISTMDGSTLDFPHGIRVEGKLFFSHSANVTIRTTAIFVLGLLKIDTPDPGNKVKVHLYGEEQMSYTANSSSDLCGSSCGFGSKVIAVVGGTLDIQGYDPTCPAWEKLQDVGTGRPREFHVPCVGDKCLTLEIAGACKKSDGHTNNLGKETVYCPIKQTAIVPFGEKNDLRFRSLPPANDVEDFVTPTDGSGKELDVKIRSPCTRAGHTDALGKCVLQCPIEETAIVPGGDRKPLTFTSVRPINSPFVPLCDGSQCLSLEVAGDCRTSAGHSNHVGKLVVYCPLKNTADIPYGYGGSLRFTNSASGASLSASGVHHWAWKGKTMFFYPDVEDESEVQNAFPVGSTVSVAYENTAPGGGELAVSGVHHWAWGGKTMFFYPEGYSVSECGQAVDDFNKVFPARYGVNIKYRAPPLNIEPGQEFVARGVHHWAWNGNLLFFHPDISANQVSAMFPPGYRMEVHYESATDLHDIVVSERAAACWKPGDEVLLTSHTRWSDDRQVATIEKSDTATNTITLRSPIQHPISLRDHLDYAVEVALLSRPVVFEADADVADPKIGGHLIVHHTNSPQRIEGVEIRKFGQQGRLGRYPLHFHWCGDSVGSVVKNNVIRNSNQRGYVLHVTNEVLVEDNVALDVVGHCYFLEQGTEQGNVFRRNLGAGIVKMSHDAVELLGIQSKRTESDDQASVFWISNPDNSFESNVAAGSNHFGYWFETHGLANRHGTVRLFADNEAHSIQSFAFTTYSPGWRPSEVTKLTGLKVYRNVAWGAFLHVTRNLHFIDSLFSDNGARAVMINRGDSILFQRTTFHGSTEYADDRPCGQGGKYAIALHPSRLNEFDYSGKVRGTSVVDSDFYDWSSGSTGCDSGSGPMDFTTSQVFTKAFNAPHMFKDVFFETQTDSPVETGVASCNLYDTLGIEDVVLEVPSDESRAFSDEGVPGFLVSPRLKTLFPNSAFCSTYNTCLDFCQGVCLRTISVLTDSSFLEDITMTVRSTSGSINVDRELREGNTENPGFFGVFTVVLPEDVFNVTFLDSEGSQVWPGFAVPVFEAAPECNHAATLKSITFDRPLPDREFCNNPVQNGDFTNGLSSWQGQGSGNTFSEAAGVGGSGALQTTQRTNMQGHWVQQWLDTSCVEEGAHYILEIYYRNVDSDGNTISACAGDNNDCPAASLGYSSLNPISGKFEEKWKSLGSTELPYVSDGSEFNMIRGLWEVTAAEAASDRFRLMINGGTSQLILDNVSLQKMSSPIDYCRSSNQVRNGDASLGFSSGWNGWANPVGVESPGYGDTGYALKAYDRDRWVRGLVQDIPQLACVIPGSTWRAQFRSKLYDQTTLAPISSCEGGCSKLRLHTMHRIESETVHNFHVIEDPVMKSNWVEDWNTFDVTFPITEKMAEGELVLFRFMVVGGPVNSVLLLDDVDFRAV